MLKNNAWVFADNVILFNLEDYLDYVRSSSKYNSKFVLQQKSTLNLILMEWRYRYIKMKFNTLDLHGCRHADIKIEENYLYLNQEDCRY